MKTRAKQLFTCILIIVLAVTSMVFADHSDRSEVQAAENFQVHFIDVGAGDGALLQYGSGSSAKYALIDAGPVSYKKTDGSRQDTSNNVLNYLKARGIKTLEFVIMTHPHKDHIGGFISILNDTSINIKKVYSPSDGNTVIKIGNPAGDDGDEFDSSTLKKVNAAMAARGYTYTIPKVGDNIYLGGAKLTIYSAGSDQYTYGRSVNLDTRQVNKYSIVCKITYGSNSFLMTGDAQRETIENIVARGYDLSAQVLKQPHHGYQDVTDEGKVGDYTSDHKFLIDKVNPAVTVISNGYENAAETPFARVLKDLIKSNVYLTSTKGTIVVTSNGSKLTLSTQKNGTDPDYMGEYQKTSKSSSLMQSVKVTTNGGSSLAPVKTSSSNTYKIYKNKNIYFKISGKTKSFLTLKEVKYKAVPKGKSFSDVSFKKGTYVKVKNGFRGRIYMRFYTSAGATPIKTKGFYVDTKAPYKAKIYSNKKGLKTLKATSRSTLTNTYKKSVKLSFKALFGVSGKKSIQYKVVPWNRRASKYKWKTGTKITFAKKKKKVRIYARFISKSGKETIRKASYIYIKK